MEELSIPARMAYTFLAGAVSLGAVWGHLVHRSRSNTARIDKIEIEHEADIEALRESITNLAEQQAAHRTETTDRLARIETKLDQLITRE